MSIADDKDRAANIMPVFSYWGDNIVLVSRTEWEKAERRICSIIRQLHKEKKRQNEKSVNVKAVTEMLTVGTKIRFLRTLTARATGDHPALEYAHHNETGEITEVGGCWEGYWVKTDSWPNAFGCESKDFEAL